MQAWLWFTIEIIQISLDDLNPFIYTIKLDSHIYQSQPETILDIGLEWTWIKQ